MNAPAMKNLAAPAIRLHPNDNVLVARIDLVQFPNVDGVAAFTHSTGCGMELSGEHEFVPWQIGITG